MPEYLDIPFSFDTIINQKDAHRVDMKNSIHNMIHLITVSSYNEVKYDPYFGTDIAEYDFENIYNTHVLKDELKNSVLQSIRNNEKRLVNVNVELQIEQVELAAMIRSRRVKTQIKMKVQGVIDKTNEPLVHAETFFIGPFSY